MSEGAEVREMDKAIKALLDEARERMNKETPTLREVEVSIMALQIVVQLMQPRIGCGGGNQC